MVSLAAPQPLVAHSSNDSHSKSTVPVKATCLGIVNLAFVVVIFYLLTMGFGQVASLHFGMALGTFCVVIQMPLVLLLTVKSNQKKREKASSVIGPPKGLRIHENSIIVTNATID